ncbi:type II toxin-antitoxin system RelE/ParE family toxin [Arthrobacter sp. cf158]|uniref:type II toxin-antitoxin system RelE family toxin n=1 Tax=Arthrobacter sp. cf158 TaxID=1761744 RepID=UPI0026772BDE|nr:type II toxin-antitoxin system RelE/ParE family toxin [Arthrobacter sp. cf158]
MQAAIEILAESPHPPGAKKLSGSSGDWRVRTGDYRIIYEIRDAQLIVLLVAMGHRQDIYQQSVRLTDPSAHIAFQDARRRT